MWCWRRLLRVPWTARRSSQSILKEIIPGYSLEGLMLKLKLQYLGHLTWRFDSLEKTLTLGGIGGRREGDDRGWDGWMASPTWWTWVWVNSRSWLWTGRSGVLWHIWSQRVGHYWVTELNWTAAAAKSLQSCPTLCDPIDSSPPGSTVPGILQARTLEWVAISFSMNWTEHCPIPNNTNYIDKLVYYRWFSSNQQNNHSNFLWF